MTRAALVFAFLATGSCAALADDARPASPADIGPAPWAEAAASPAFAPEDAYLFSDPAVSLRLDPDAEAAAVLVDRRRMAEPPALSAGLEETGRVATAFAGFVAYGRDGRATASLALARAGEPVRVAAAPPWLANFALALAGR